MQCDVDLRDVFGVHLHVQSIVTPVTFLVMLSAYAITRVLLTYRLR